MLEQNRDSLARLPLLIELFYGFAIANGLSDAFKSTIEKEILFQWLFLILAFLLGLGDWLGYHMHVSHIPYRSICRLLLDLIFPALVYCLLLAPTLTPSPSGISYTAWIVFIYFEFAILYSILLRREDSHADPPLMKVVLTAWAVSSASLLCNYLLSAGLLRMILVDLLATSAVAIWACYNLRLVYKTMNQPRQVQPDSTTIESVKAEDERQASQMAG